MHDDAPRRLIAIHIGPAAGAPLVAVDCVTAVRGRGLTGDRYFAKTCAHLEGLTQPGVLKAFIHRGGLRADIVTGGELRVGAAIVAL